MRIALVSEWLDAWRGGAETSTFQFIHHLLAEGVEVDVVTRSRLSPIPGLRVHVVPVIGLTRAQRSSAFSRRAQALAAGLGADLVHAISPCLGADVYQPRGGTVAESIERNLALLSSPAARSLKRWANRFNFKQRFALDIERRLFHPGGGPVVVAISRYVAEQLRRHYRLPEQRLRVVYNAVDPDDTPLSQRLTDRAQVRHDYGVGEDEFLVILVAHNFRLKGVARWMEAHARLLSEGMTDLRSLVIGKAHSPRWQREASRMGLKGCLRFVGPTRRVPAFMHAADLLVHPTYYDPCSRVVLEALSSGLPCVTTRFDGAAEIIEEGITGSVIDAPDRLDQLMAAVDYWRNAGRRREVAAAAAAMRERISMVRHARELIEVYQGISRRGADVPSSPKK